MLRISLISVIRIYDTCYNKTRIKYNSTKVYEKGFVIFVKQIPSPTDIQEKNIS